MRTPLGKTVFLAIGRENDLITLLNKDFQIEG